MKVQECVMHEDDDDANNIYEMKMKRNSYGHLLHLTTLSKYQNLNFIINFYMNLKSKKFSFSFIFRTQYHVTFI